MEIKKRGYSDDSISHRKKPETTPSWRTITYAIYHSHSKPKGFSPSCSRCRVIGITLQKRLAHICKNGVDSMLRSWRKTLIMTSSCRITAPTGNGWMKTGAARRYHLLHKTDYKCCRRVTSLASAGKHDETKMCFVLIVFIPLSSVVSGCVRP